MTLKDYIYILDILKEHEYYLKDELKHNAYLLEEAIKEDADTSSLNIEIKTLNLKIKGIREISNKIGTMEIR